ncbi:DPP IV N-terminal domain-containing protein [Algoriphagus halophilus]|uniref:TolB family protein n=1 Tax=Algoriphagus halophilus TaxID=226505 RepID=UPI00358F29D4
MNYRNWILLSILMISVFALQAQDKKPIQLSDLTNIVSVSNPEITPDGQKVLFVKNYMEAEKDGKFDYKRQLILMNLNHPELTKVLNSPTYEISNFTLSPDGKKLAFTKSWEGKSQIWILPMDGGESQVLTDEKDGASSPVWSPDGSKILFLSPFLFGPWKVPLLGRTLGQVEAMVMNPTMKPLMQVKRRKI